MNEAIVVSLIIYKNGKFLVEKRKSSKIDDPGKVMLPSGHVEKGETLEEACKRELKEELDLECNNFKFITKFPHQSKREKLTIHFFSCVNWRGVPKSIDAEKLMWMAPEELDIIDYDIDKRAIKKYIKILNN